MNGDGKAVTAVLNDTNKTKTIHKNVTFGSFDAAIVTKNERQHKS